MSSLSQILGWTWLLVSTLSSGPADAPTTAPDAFPGMQLRARLEVHLEGRREALKQTPTHYALLFELEQPDLLAFMEPIQVHRDRTGFVLGVAYGPESYAGGLLALLLDAWRPAGRAARLEDTFFFEASRHALALEQLYRSYQRQIFLPVPGKEAETIYGELPDGPRLPRMRFRYPTAPEPVETPAYRFLGLLVAHEDDASATWTNHLGQELSVELLIRNVRADYLTHRGTDAELEDHSRLHLVELLLAYDRCRASAAADEIKKRFLQVELGREEFEGEAGREALAHYVESLGALLAQPCATWLPQEKRRVRAWLHALERDRFRDLDAVPLQHQSHLLRGLRLIGAHRDRLE